jgi:phospholipase C
VSNGASHSNAPSESLGRGDGTLIRFGSTAAYAAVVLLLVVSPTILSSTTVSTFPPNGGGSGYTIVKAFGPESDHIRHVITVVMENHDYDNLFGTYCLTLGPYCSTTGTGIPSGTCVTYLPSDPQFGCIKPYNLTVKELNITDLPHDWVSGAEAYNDGAMNNFYSAELDSTLPFGHYNGSTVPISWDLAEQYAIGDNFFAANLSYSLPNHWDLLAGATPNVAYDTYVKNGTDRVLYLNQANATPTVQDLLNGTSVSWNYYDFPLENETHAVTSSSWDSAYDYWSPMAGKAESYSPNESVHFVARQQLLTDLSDGSLPDLSWVIPSAPYSEHPGYNITEGEGWLAQLVDAVENSPDWSSTAIFVTWDDYGGWYDHVAPSFDGSDLLSFRAPIMVISPYARENFISSQYLTFFSLLHFDEWQFGLGCLTSLDCNAPLPFSFFNFNQTVRPPMMFPTNWLDAEYPMPLQTLGSSQTLCPTCGAENWQSWTYDADPEFNASLGD